MSRDRRVNGRRVGGWGGVGEWEEGRIGEVVDRHVDRLVGGRMVGGLVAIGEWTGDGGRKNLVGCWVGRQGCWVGRQVGGRESGWADEWAVNYKLC